MKLTLKINFISSICIIIISLSVLLTPSISKAQKSMMINIDNPNFRKLVVATPSFIVDKSSSAAMTKLAKEGSEELSKMLTFSRFFNLISEAAYSDLLKTLRQKNTLSLLKDPSKARVEGINISDWKSIGVEALIVGELRGKENSMELSLVTIDINKNNVVLGKKYSNIKENEFKTVLRRYADQLLKAYTGKTGIFSSKIVFVGKKHSTREAKQIYVCDYDGTNVVKISKNDNAIHISPSWSWDGRYITYTSYEKKNPDLYLYEVKTGKTRVLSNTRGVNSGGNWAPNNQLIAFTGSRQDKVDIFITDVTGKNKKTFIKGNSLDVDPKFSPDGKYFAFVSGRYGNPHIFVATLQWDGPLSPKIVDEKRLTFAGWYNATPAWSPDSEKIAFGGFDKDINRFDIFLMNKDGKQLERLTLKNGDNENPSWSPNGQLIVFQSNRVEGRTYKGRAQLYVMSRDGSDQRKLNTGMFEAQTPSWSTPLE